MAHVYENAATRIIDWFHRAEHDLVGRVVQHTNGEAGTVTGVKLDSIHGVCFTFEPDPHIVFRNGHAPVRWYPVSTIRMKR